MLSVNVKSDYALRSPEGGGRAGEREREREREYDSERKEGLRYQCAEPMAFPQSSWLASG